MAGRQALVVGSVLSCLLMSALAWESPRSAAGRGKGAEIGALMTSLYQRGQFNGAVLVEAQGTTVYRAGFGKANVQTGADFTPDTPSNIGSLAKQFTAMAIMMLAERGRLGYDDRVSTYLPELSGSAHLSRITVRQLLNHTAGIPDYGDLGIDDAGLGQQGLMAALMKREDRLGKAGQKYRYSNPGYALLAMVVERVGGRRFGTFLEEEVFAPLGMSNTFVYDSPARKNARMAVGYGQFGQVDDTGPTAIPGDSGIYSTVDDLGKWDGALETERLVRQSTLAEAWTPGKVERGTSHYGFGWNIEEEGGSKHVWHQGSVGGFRAYIGRRLGDRVTVILLTNRGNSKRQEIDAAIENILAGRAYVMPRRSGAEKLYETIAESGIDAGLRMFPALRTSDYDVGETELNTLGYQLLYGDRRAGEAIAIFKLNAKEHPVSSNAFDSLGEAYAANGERTMAILSYARAVALDPANGHAAGELKKLGGGRAGALALLTAICAGGTGVLLVQRRRRRRRAGGLGRG